ncbi:plasmid mobilization protein [Nocardioides lijunqiniae]|uniref:plasmid mobilization protein n=1 Tax=Nocardioides lijunqiniae TaxID=2760832 RepID=UPI00187752FF
MQDEDRDQAAASPAPGAGPEPARRGGGRRQPRRAGERREFRHEVKVNGRDEEALILRAAARNISVSRLLVESALAGGAEAARTKTELAEELIRANRLLIRLGTNVNQIARATNATLETQPETMAAMEAVERLCGRLERFVDGLEQGGRRTSEVRSR